MTVEQQLAATQRTLRALQRRNTQMFKAYQRLLACQSAAALALELRSERTRRAFQACTGERLFTESEVKPLVDALKEIAGYGQTGGAEREIDKALAHAKELGL